tara:strand:+ start:1012 stop:1563 length:552 start_codon:yes stop_codon:yes gene_type:complete
MPGTNRADREKWHRPERVKRCIMCGVTKPLGDFYAYAYTTRQGKLSTRYESRCAPCARARRRAEYPKRRDTQIKQQAKWRQANKTYIAEYDRAYRKSERGRQMKAKAQRTREARKRAKLSGPEKEEITAIYQQAIDLENLFGVRLHVDHHIPLAKGGKHKAVNLRILLARENQKKGTRMPVNA